MLCQVCQGKGPFVLDQQQTVYRNYQKITLQVRSPPFRIHCVPTPFPPNMANSLRFHTPQIDTGSFCMTLPTSRLE